jgi:hypothetical protein
MIIILTRKTSSRKVEDLKAEMKNGLTILMALKIRQVQDTWGGG